MKQRNKERYSIILCLCTALVVFASGCSQPTAESSSSQTAGEATAPVVDKPLADSQGELLQLSFQLASKLPVSPHIKDRSRAQQGVVEVCLQLDQPQRALEYLKQIDNWRRGYCYAALAFYTAQAGNEDEARVYLKRAEELAQSTEDWRKDRIRVKVAQTYVVLGELDKAAKFSQGVVEAETGKVAQVKARLGDAASFDEQVQQLDALIATGTFDVVKNALKACALLYGRFYDNAGRRAMLEDRIKSSWDALPPFIRIELLLQLSQAAAEHDDQDKAVALVQEARTMLDSFEWRLEDRLPLWAQIIEQRYKVGDRQAAAEAAAEALARFRQDGDRIVNIYRAEALRPLAEAYVVMGATEKALTVYKLVVEESVANPNSRPRAEDLSATCNSLARYNVTPDNDLWERLRTLHEGLGAPW